MFLHNVEGDFHHWFLHVGSQWYGTSNRKFYFLLSNLNLWSEIKSLNVVYNCTWADTILTFVSSQNLQNSLIHPESRLCLHRVLQTFSFVTITLQRKLRTIFLSLFLQLIDVEKSNIFQPDCKESTMDMHFSNLFYVQPVLTLGYLCLCQALVSWISPMGTNSHISMISNTCTLTLVMGPWKTHTKCFWGQTWPQGCFQGFAYSKIVWWIFIYSDIQKNPKVPT